MTLQEKIAKAKKSKNTRRTSSKWCLYFDIIPTDILDPSGWDRDDFHYDFYNTSLTYSQFDFRIGQSTCKDTASKYCTVKLIKNQNGDNGHTDADDSDIASTESKVDIETEEESKPTNGGTSSEEEN